MVVLALCCLLRVGTVQAAVIENPEPGSVQSGVFIVSGWKCEAQGTIALRFNNGPEFPVVYGSDRADTAGVCGDTDNGWVLLFNYNLLPEGLNFVEASDDAGTFATVSFEVIKLNGEEFLKGVSGECTTVVASNQVHLRWQEERQGFGIIQAVPREEEACLAPGGSLSGPQTYAYVDGGTSEQTLDLYQMQGLTTPRPVLVWIHAGDWISGSKEDIAQLAFDIASQAGFHLVSVGYRLANNVAAPPLETVHDIKAAIRWLKINAGQFGIDPNVLIVAGESSGAHLAAVIATSSDVAVLEGSHNLGPTSGVAAGIGLGGLYDFRTVVDQADETFSALGCSQDLNLLAIWTFLDCVSLLNLDNLDSCQTSNIYLGSPVFHVDAADPPMFLAHGQLDCVVPWQQSQDMAGALSSAGVSHQFSAVANGTHDVGSLGITVAEILAFIEANTPCGNAL